MELERALNHMNLSEIPRWHQITSAVKTHSHIDLVMEVELCFLTKTLSHGTARLPKIIGLARIKASFARYCKYNWIESVKTEDNDEGNTKHTSLLNR